MAPSRGAVGDEEELDDEVAGGAEGKVVSEGEAAGAAAADASGAGAEGSVGGSSFGTSSGVSMTPPGGIFSLLYLHPGT